MPVLTAFRKAPALERMFFHIVSFVSDNMMDLSISSSLSHASCHPIFQSHRMYML